MQRIFSFDQLNTADLIVDARYLGGGSGNAGDDPFTRLLGLSNMGGFRYRGDIEGKVDLLMILSTFSDPDWPDYFDVETGVFQYFGDNKRPGQGLHSTGKRGNRMLKRIFEDAYSGPEGRQRVPPTFVFARGEPGRAVDFLGLAVPGTSDVREGDDLVAIWKVSQGNRFQNYRANFAILDANEISRAWIQSLIQGEEDSTFAPQAWKEWRATGRRLKLAATRSVEWRSKSEQYPTNEDDIKILEVVRCHFQENPHAFEECAVEIAKMIMPNITAAETTRQSRDGGRDAVGKYRIGSGASSILAEFALEAKCFSPPTGVGVRYLSRLISRLRHRQFGVMVTTTWVDSQAYREIVEDGHPIVVISGSDIATTLRNAGLSNPRSLKDWLETHFPNVE